MQQFSNRVFDHPQIASSKHGFLEVDLQAHPQQPSDACINMTQMTKEDIVRILQTNERLKADFYKFELYRLVDRSVFGHILANSLFNSNYSEDVIRYVAVDLQDSELLETLIRHNSDFLFESETALLLRLALTLQGKDALHKCALVKLLMQSISGLDGDILFKCLASELGTAYQLYIDVLCIALFLLSSDDQSQPRLSGSLLRLLGVLVDMLIQLYKESKVGESTLASVCALLEEHNVAGLIGQYQEVDDGLNKVAAYCKSYRTMSYIVKSNKSMNTPSSSGGLVVEKTHL